MAYVSDWEQLPDVLKRVMTATGQSTEEAQTDICRAVSDGAIKVQAKLGKHATRPMHSRDIILNGQAFQIPSDLKPGELDWQASCPLQPWYVRRGAHKLPGHWHLEWMRLSTADVTNVLCTVGTGSGSTPPSEHSVEVKARSRPARMRIERAIKALYPDGLPEQDAEPNKILCQRVADWLKNNSFPHVSDDTILRAAGRRK